jgi:hypothetical protein
MKPKIHIMPGIIVVASAIWGFMAVQRWWIKYPDTSQLILALLIALIGISGGIVWNWMRNMEKGLEDHKDRTNNRLDALYDEIQKVRG